MCVESLNAIHAQLGGLYGQLLGCSCVASSRRCIGLLEKIAGRSEHPFRPDHDRGFRFRCGYNTARRLNLWGA